MAAGAFTVIQTPAPYGPPRGRHVEHWQETWSSVLARHVDAGGRVDVAGLAEDRGGLDEVVRFIAAIDPVSSPAQFPTSNARLAYYIDAYNALAMHGVLESELAWHPPYGREPSARPGFC